MGKALEEKTRIFREFEEWLSDNQRSSQEWQSFKEQELAHNWGDLGAVIIALEDLSFTVKDIAKAIRER